MTTLLDALDTSGIRILRGLPLIARGTSGDAPATENSFLLSIIGLFARILFCRRDAFSAPSGHPSKAKLIAPSILVVPYQALLPVSHPESDHASFLSHLRISLDRASGEDQYPLKTLVCSSLGGGRINSISLASPSTFRILSLMYPLTILTLI